MISVIDICDMCGLDQGQIDAIAEHEHLPEVAAAALGHYLLHLHHGVERIRDMIADDLHAALERGERRHAAELLMALRHLYTAHPEVRHLPPRSASIMHGEAADPRRSSGGT